MLIDVKFSIWAANENHRSFSPRAERPCITIAAAYWTEHRCNHLGFENERPRLLHRRLAASPHWAESSDKRWFSYHLCQTNTKQPRVQVACRISISLTTWSSDHYFHLSTSMLDWSTTTMLLTNDACAMWRCRRIWKHGVSFRSSGIFQNAILRHLRR
jgi:hypothetical protein